MTILKIQPIYLLLIAILSFQCKTANQTGNGRLPSELINYWTNSHEEDSEGLKTYRPRGYNFPESRGRESLEILSNGSYVEYKIGPTDRPLPVSGTVSYDAKSRTLVLTPAETKYRTWKIEIVKLEPKLLIFKRLD